MHMLYTLVRYLGVEYGSLGNVFNTLLMFTVCVCVCAWVCTRARVCVHAFTGELQYEFTLHLNVSILVIEGVIVCICGIQVKICNYKSVCESLELLGLTVGSWELYYVHSCM
jgi:hypothetical protein